MAMQARLHNYVTLNQIGIERQDRRAERLAAGGAWNFFASGRV